ncbi:MAG: gliding motility-associated C-terminal domain-containing protein [Bacteroidetes bacterium]|nr:gliding motility-associated C-terminal domain-containing protein [Bacteroidota bacterium]
MITYTVKVYRRLILFLGLFIFSTALFAQTCKPVGGACPASAGVTCSFAATIEKGCNCYDGVDNDGDGKIDGADTDCASYLGLTFVGSGSTCTLPPPGNINSIFTGVANVAAAAQNTADTPAHVAVGDMNGDGVPDACVTSKWNSTIQVVATATASGFSPGDIMGDWRTPGKNIFPTKGADWTFEHEMAIADIDKDGIGEMFTIASKRPGGPNSPPEQFVLCGFKYANNSLIPLWNAVDLGVNRPGNPGLADFDGDGKAEVYIRNKIFAAESGALLADGGGNWLTAINTGSVAVNITGDSKLELVCGNLIYTVPSLASRTLQVLTVYKDMNVDFPATKFYPKGYNDVNEYGITQASTTSVADFDADGFVDVFITGAVNCSGNEGAPCGTNRTTIFYWNVQKNTLQTYQPPDGTYALGWNWGTGRINLYDVYPNHGHLEALFTAGNKVFCLDEATFTTGNPLWVRTTNDALSGILSLTCYDFNNDGNPEVVYRDTQQLIVCDGQTGATTIFASTCQSHTMTEGPIIADVNGDGATDICITCYTNTGAFDINKSTPQQQSLGQLHVYYTNSSSWLPTRKVWNQHPYFVTNILDNLQLPTTQISQDLVFGTGACPNGVQGPQMPLNLFMDQVPHLSASGCPEFPAPDLAFYGDTPSPACDANPALAGCDTNGDGSYLPTVKITPPICGNLGITAQFNIVNNGDLAITDNIPISFFNGDPTVGTSAVRLYNTTMNVTNLGIGQTYTSPIYTFNGPGSTFTLYAVIYNDGSVLPIVLTGSSTKECTISNNIYSTVISPSPFTVTTETVQDNLNCPPYAAATNNGQLRSRIYINGVEQVDYSPYAFQWYDASSNPISGATLYNLSNLDQGTYYVKVTNTQKGCSSALVPGTITRANPAFPGFTITKISDQTLCSPANGELVVAPVDGSTGYTYTWLDNALNPIGVSGADAKNLLKGNYVVQITRGTCTNPVSPPPSFVDGPKYPDATATTLANVVDCLNPNSGSVTSDAIFNGTVQNPAGYTFNWYFYNFATSTRGSLLPAGNGTGQTRTGLAAGYYQVVVTDNTTKCDATSAPLAQVTTSTVLPTAAISQVAPQTSCDPNQPNGILTAAGTAAGYSNPTDFKFEWFRGDNTLAANLIPIAGGPETLSGAKGETLNKAKGGGIIYTVRVTTPLNCSATNKLTLIEDVNTPVLTLAQSPNSICDVAKTNPAIAYNGSITATVTFTQGGVTNTITLPDPNYTFNWYDGTTTTTAHNPATSGGPTLSGLKDADYTATVTRTDLFCTSVPQTKTVLKTTVQPLLSPTSTGSNNCDPALTPDGTVTVAITNTQAGHNYTYQWYKGNSVVPANALGAANNGTSATAIKVGGPVGSPNPYTVYVLDQTSGCDNTTTQTVSDVSVIPVLSTSTTPNSICSPASSFNGSMTATVTNLLSPPYTIADYSFAWYDGGTTAVPHNPATTGVTISGLDVGTYSVTGKNTKTGCISSLYTNQVITAKVFPALLPASTGSNNCDPALTPDGTVSYSVTNTAQSAGPFTQQWYTGSGDPIANGLPILPAGNNGTQVTAIKVGGPTGAPKSYTVLVTNSSTGCTNYTTASVPDNSIVPILSTSTTPNSVCDPALGYQGTMTVTVTNIPVNPPYTIADYTFVWKNSVGVVVPDPTPGTPTVLDKLADGSYSVVGTNTQTGCVSASFANTVSNNRVFPSLTPSATGSNNCDNTLTPDGTVSVSAAGTAGPYAYQWYVGSGDPIAGGFPTVPTAPNNGKSATAIQLGGPTGAPHSYTALVTDTPTGCTAFATAVVADLSVSPILLTSTQPNDICSPATSFAGSMTVSLSNAQAVGAFPADYVFTWYDGNTTGVQHNPQPAPTSTVTLPKLDAGTYSVTGKNTKTGCISVLATDMVQDQKINPALQLSTTGSHNCTNAVASDGTATATVTNAGADNFNFVWVEVAPTTAINGTNNNITNNAVTATAIKLGGPTNAPNSYQVTVTNTRSGCVTSNTAQVSDLSQKPTFNFAATDNSVCTNVLGIPFNGHVDASGIAHPQLAGSTITYTWYNADPVTSALILPADHTDANQAVVTDSWNALGKGKYAATVTITSVDCTSDPLIVDVKDVPVLPAFTVTPTPSTNCPGGADNGSISATVNNAGGNTFTFDWHKGNLVTDPAVGSVDASPTTTISNQKGAQNYTVQATNNQTGCKANFTQALADNSVKPTFTLTIVDNDKCVAPEDGSATVAGLTDPNALGGDTYTVSFTSTVSAPQTGASMAYLIQPASFATATVKNDRLGCTSAPVTQEIKELLTYPTITTSVVNSTNCAGGAPNGSATVTAVLPADTYEYRWYAGNSVGAPGTEINGAAPTGIAGISGKQGAADFTVEVNLTSTGCRGSKTVTIQDVSQLPLITPLSSTPNQNCTAPFNGTAFVDAVTPFTYRGTTITSPYTGFTLTWSGGTVGPADKITALIAGNYTLQVKAIAGNTVTNNNDNCISNLATVTINDNLTYPVISVTVTDQTSCSGTPNGKLAASSPGVSYAWFDGIGTGGAAHAQTAANSGIIDQLASGDYTIQVTDNVTRCVSTESDFVPNNIVNPSLSFMGVSPVTKCNAPDGSATASIANLSAPTMYDIHYVYTSTLSGAAYPTDPTEIKPPPFDPANHTYTSLINQAIVPAPYTGMMPGYLTALVVDKNTMCESTPVTQQIIDNTQKSTITVITHAVPGACGGGNGGMDPTVLPGAVYTYHWYTGSPNNPTAPINFFTNPPSFAGPEIYGDGRQNLGITGGDLTIGAGTYTLVVFDPDGCGTYHTDNVPTASAPTFTIAPTDITRCDVPNGKLDVQVTTGVNVNGYSIKIFLGNDATGTLLTQNAGPPFPLAPTPVLSTAATLSAATYFVEVTDEDFPACPMGRNQVLINKVLPPSITIDQIVANTSCDPNTSADGKVQLTVNSDASDAQAKLYYVSNINPLPVGFVLNPAPGNLIGTGASGQTTGLMNGFEPQATVPSYTITVTDDNSKCTTDAVVIIPDQQAVPSPLTVVPSPESVCTPSSNGSALASVAPDPVTEYDFEWYSDNALASIVNDGIAVPKPGNGLGTGGELLNQGKIVAPAVWPMGATGLSSGDRIFYVRGKKNATAASGVGCYTQVVQVTIQDQHVAPTMTLTSIPNTSCDPAIGEGSISINTVTNSGVPAVSGATYTYIFDPLGAATTHPNRPGAAPLEYTSVLDNTWTMRATNDVNGCKIESNVTIAPSKFSMTITAFTSQDKLMCNPDGSINVTQIITDRTLTGQANVNYAPAIAPTLANNFDFRWFRTTAPTGFVDPSALTDGAATVIPGEQLTDGAGAGQYPTMGSGLFYVIAKHKSAAGDLIGQGCTTPPIQVNINDKHVNPTVTLVPFSDTSCNLAAGFEGSIDVTISDASVTIPASTPYNYNYGWVVTSTTTPVVANPYVNGTTTFANLQDGDYTLTATNNMTGCATTSNTTIIKNVTPVFVNNFTITPQLICNNSGDIQITGITYKDRFGNPQPAPVVDFSFTWTRPVVGTVGNASALLNTASYPGISADVYSVTAKRIANSPGNGCISAPINIEIQDKSVKPVPSLTVLSNTSCNSMAPGEGEIKINVNDATPAPNNGGTYTYTWNTLPPTQVIPAANPGANDGDGDGTDGDEDNPKLLLDGAYNLTIKNNLTGCTVVANTTILKNSVPVFVQTVNATDQISCAAIGDGSLTVAKVSVNDRAGTSTDYVPPPPGAGQGNITDFDFDWTRAGVGPQTTTGVGGNVLNSGNYNIGALGGTGIGAGSYTVTAIRTTGSPGNGCKSAAFPVTIKDKRINPVITLTPFSNTSCNIAFEGEIKVKVTDATTFTPVPAGGFTFNYSWTASAGVTAPGASAGNNGNEVNDGAGPDQDFLVGQQDGTYNLTAVNPSTQCQTTASTVITKNATPVFVQNVSVVDQIVCTPDGSLTIAKVTLNDRTGTTTTFDNTTVPALLTDFQFEWTRPADAHIEVMNSGVAPAGATLNAGNYDAAFASQPFGAGTYTVVARRKAGSPGANCASAPYTIVLQDKSTKPVVALSPFANTSCSGVFEGEIEVRVTDATANNVAHTFVTPYAYTYNWTVSATPAVINGVVAGTNDGDGSGADGDGDNPKVLQDGNYTVSVTNTQTGCVSTGSTTIFKNSTPVFTQLVTPTDQVLCTADGKLVVNQVKVIDRNGVTKLSGVDFPIADFVFTYDRSAVGTTVLGPNSPSTLLDNTNYGTIGFGTYFVTATRNSGSPGAGCSAAPYKVDILDKRILPSVSLTPLANTSCDPAFFEGEIKVKVTDASVNIPAPLTGIPFTYDYTWPTAVTAIAASAGNDGDGFGGGENDGAGIDNDNDHPKGLKDGNFIVTVTNAVTGCSSDGSTTIFKNGTPVFTQLVVSTAQVLCKPDGKLEVKEVKIIDRNGVTQSNLNTPPDFPLTDFVFTYDRVIAGVTTNVLTNSVNAFLDNTNYNNPPIPPGVGFGTYYVTTTRKVGFPGKECSSAPYRIDIDDQRLYPKVAFTSLANSACNVAKANGSVTAIASEQNGAQTDPYTFAWTLNGTPVASVLPVPPIQTDATPQSVLTNALDGAYIVTATNTNTGCPFDASFNLLLDQTRSTPNIIDVATLDPKDCNPTAGAEVTKITLGSTFNSSLQPPQIPPNNEVTGAALGPPRFIYTWYEGTLSNQLAPTLPCIGPLPNSCNTATVGLLPGDHFVKVIDTQTDCQSGPKQFVIKTDNIIYPVAAITQTVKQISCIATTGTGELQATAIEQDGTTGTYTFAWYPSLDLTGTAFAPPTAPSSTNNPNLLQKLVVGDYSIQVTNTVTSCTASAIFIIPDDSPLFIPAISTGSSPQTFCVGNDGDAQVRILLDPAYPLLPYDNTAFITDLYKTSKPNLSNPPDVQANIPFIVTGSPSTITYDVPQLVSGTYTFRVTDKNTGCVRTDSVAVKLQQTKPVIVIVQDNPMTNCDPVIANGQLSSTADGKVQGYNFDWYAGAAASGSILQNDNKLIGQQAGSYTVRGTNNLTGCFDDKTGKIDDATVKPPVPIAVVLHDQTRCILPHNGEVAASVGGVTIGYSFQWYNGTNTKPTVDFRFADYFSLDVGDYTVTATDDVTHCVSPPATVTVADKRVKPIFEVAGTPSYCIEVGKPTGNGTFTVTQKVSVNFEEIKWSLAGDTTTAIGLGPYIADLFPGDYHVLVTTSEKCQHSENVKIETEIKPYNLVSTNNDGQNDAFIIDCISNFPNNNVKIFNRNGTMVYEVDGYNNQTVFFRGVGEKGVYLADKELPEGTYFYIIDKKNGTKPKTGFIELVR